MKIWIHSFLRAAWISDWIRHKISAGKQRYILLAVHWFSQHFSSIIILRVLKSRSLFRIKNHSVVRRALECSDKEKVLMQLSGRFLLTNVSQIGICGACKILLSNFINKYLRFRPLITFRWAVFIWWDYSHYRRHRFDLMNSIVCSAAEFKCGQPLVKVTIIQLWKKVSRWKLW